MDHIVSILQAPNGVRVKLLGERHSKSLDESLKCSVHIDDKRVTDILFENVRLTKFSQFMLTMVRKITHFDGTTSSINYANINTRFNTRTRFNVSDDYQPNIIFYKSELATSQINQNEIIYHGPDNENKTLGMGIEPKLIKSNTRCETYQNKVIYHDLEKDSKAYIGDELFALMLIPILGLSSFTSRYPGTQYLFAPMLGYQFMNFLFLSVVEKSKLSYPTKSKLSQWLVCDTILYRRDKIMAQSIIEHVKTKVQEDDNLSLCIFGSAHHEGICHYLQKDGFTFVEKPVEF
jgi:hypothetical protein